MLSPDAPPGFRAAIRLTALGGQLAFTLSVALARADIASQLAPLHQRALWFALVGGTAGLIAWRVWAWIFKRVGIS